MACWVHYFRNQSVVEFWVTENTPPPFIQNEEKMLLKTPFCQISALEQLFPMKYAICFQKVCQSKQVRGLAWRRWPPQLKVLSGSAHRVEIFLHKRNRGETNVPQTHTISLPTGSGLGGCLLGWKLCITWSHLNIFYLAESVYTQTQSHTFLFLFYNHFLFKVFAWTFLILWYLFPNYLLNFPVIPIYM